MPKYEVNVIPLYQAHEKVMKKKVFIATYRHRVCFLHIIRFTLFFAVLELVDMLAKGTELNLMRNCSDWKARRQSNEGTKLVSRT